MKFLYLFAAMCMFVGINGQSVSTDETTGPTLEELIQTASAKFSDFMMEQSQISSDILNDFIKTKYEALSEKLERYACKRTSDLLVAKVDALNQLAQSIEYAREINSATAIKLCSIPAKIDISLYVDPELQTGIQNELMYYKSTLSQLQYNAYSLFIFNDMYTEYDKELYGENVTIESVQNYINSLDSLLSNYKYTAKSTAQNFVYKLDSFVQTFDFRTQDKQPFFQSILSNVNANFQSCLSSNYYL